MFEIPNARGRVFIAAVFVSLTTAAPALATPESAPEPVGERLDAPGDLTLSNLFSQGWNEPWRHRHRKTRNMALLRVTTNFLERELRLDYVGTDSNNPRLRSTQFANALVAYGLSRRLMVEVITNYQWNVEKVGSPISGAGGGALVRVQLIESERQSLAIQVRASPPNKGIGQTQTSIAWALAGWQDLGFAQTGLYYSVQLEDLFGNHPAAARENDVSYVLALAKTWTDSSTPVFGDLTTFVEGAGTTDLDGAARGDTLVSITPGVRFWFVPKSSVTFGVDVPVTSSPPFALAWRGTYILNF